MSNHTQNTFDMMLDTDYTSTPEPTTDITTTAAYERMLYWYNKSIPPQNTRSTDPIITEGTPKSYDQREMMLALYHTSVPNALTDENAAPYREYIAEHQSKQREQVSSDSLNEYWELHARIEKAREENTLTDPTSEYFALLDRISKASSDDFADRDNKRKSGFKPTSAKPLADAAKKAETAALKKTINNLEFQLAKANKSIETTETALKLYPDDDKLNKQLGKLTYKITEILDQLKVARDSFNQDDK